MTAALHNADGKLKHIYVYLLLTLMYGDGGDVVVICRSLAYAGFHVITTVAFRDASVIAPLFAVLRITLSLPVYLVVGCAGGYSLKITWSEFKDLALLGFTGVTMNQACFIIGLYFTRYDMNHYVDDQQSNQCVYSSSQSASHHGGSYAIT